MRRLLYETNQFSVPLFSKSFRSSIYRSFHILKLCFAFIVRGCTPGKQVQMTEQEVRGLCLKSREIFMQQPILLELEAPLIICGKW